MWSLKRKGPREPEEKEDRDENLAVEHISEGSERG